MAEASASGPVSEKARLSSEFPAADGRDSSGALYNAGMFRLFRGRGSRR